MATAERGYLQLILAGVLVGALGIGAWALYSKGYDEGYAKRVAEDAQAAIEQSLNAAAAAGALEQDRERTRTVYRTITKEVERVVEKPVYRDVCLDDDGVRVANAALSGALSPASEPHRPVPRAEPAGRGVAGGSPAEAD